MKYLLDSSLDIVPGKSIINLINKLHNQMSLTF